MINYDSLIGNRTLHKPGNELGLPRNIWLLLPLSGKEVARHLLKTEADADSERLHILRHNGEKDVKESSSVTCNTRISLSEPFINGLS
jgi:hypothetical protein